MKEIYMDHAATTYVKPQVLSAMLPCFGEIYGNPSSIYTTGQRAHSVIDDARERVAKCLGATAREIYFTGCGTESDNWAIRGTACAKRNAGNHIISSAIEHHAVLHTLQQLEKEGFAVTYIQPDDQGIIHAADVQAAITDKTILITIMYANNEIGTIQPIAEIGKIAKENKILFHTDAVQAVGAIEVNVKGLQVDMLSVSAHKFYGPKGVGALYIRNGVRPQIFMQGGGQERGRRGGTENVPGIAGMARALELAVANMEQSAEKLKTMRDHLMHRILTEIPYTRLNGHAENRLPNNVNISFRFIEGESLLLMLDINGIAASSGSACTSGSLDPSHVLLAIGLPHEIAHGSLRLSLGDDNTIEQCDHVVETLKTVVLRLRKMSPLYENLEQEGQ